MKSKKTFEMWFAAVAAEVKRKTGMDIRDLPDCPFRDWYDDKVSAASAAKKAVKNMD